MTIEYTYKTGNLRRQYSSLCEVFSLGAVLRAGKGHLPVALILNDWVCSQVYALTRLEGKRCDLACFSGP